MDDRAVTCGEVLASAVDTVGLTDREVLRTKGNDKFDYVTQTDEELDSEIREQLLAKTGYDVKSEESEYEPDEDSYWIVDPIDGTLPFSHGIVTYGSMAALVENGTPTVSAIYLPENEDLFLADEHEALKNGSPITVNCSDLDDSVAFTSIRPDGIHVEDKHKQLHYDLQEKTLAFSAFSAAYAATVIADGGATCATFVDLNEWDYMPTVRLIQSAGGVVGSLKTSRTGIKDLSQTQEISCFASSKEIFRELHDMYK